MPQPRKRANEGRKRRTDPQEEARVVMILGLLSAAGPFVVLGLRPLVALAPFATWEKVLLVGVTPVLALMSLALFWRSRPARAYREARGGAAVAATSLALAVASAVLFLTRAGPA